MRSLLFFVLIAPLVLQAQSKQSISQPDLTEDNFRQDSLYDTPQISRDPSLPLPPRDAPGRPLDTPDSGTTGHVNNPPGPPPAPPPPAPDAMNVFEAFPLGSDPQVAIGRQTILALEAHSFTFFARPAPASTIKPTAIYHDRTWNLFKALVPDINIELHLPESLCNTTTNQGNGCISEFYDARPLYDDQAHVFWIEAATGNRNLPDGDPHQQRFIVIAVSKNETPASPSDFYTYLLTPNDVADWPHMSLHYPYLVLGHHGNGNLYVFDAKAIASGNSHNKKLLLATFEESKFPSDFRHVFLVNQHDAEPGALTWLLVTVSGGELFYALQAPDDLSPGVPKLLGPSNKVDLDIVPSLPSNAVHRGGKIYTASDFTEGTLDNGATRSDIRVSRFSVSKTADDKIAASLDWSKSFGRHAADDLPTKSDSEPLISYQLPAVEVTNHDDIVVVFERSSDHMYPEARFIVLYHGQENFSPSKILHIGSYPMMGPTGYKVGIDLGAAEIDPMDNSTVWMSHGYTHSLDKSYAEVVGSVKP